MDSAGGARAAYYRPAEVAQTLRCSEWWVKEQARRRRIPFFWIGGSYLFTEEHIVTIVSLFEVRPTEQSGPLGLVGRSAPHPGVLDADAPGRLRARAPRRARRTDPTTTAA
jgi:hypothetical protein